MKFAHLVIATSVIGLTLVSKMALAQDAGAGGTQPAGQGISITTGPILPKNFPVSDEILKSFAVNYDYPIVTAGFLEGGMLFSNSHGIHYQNINVSYRADMPFQDLTVFALGGIDLMRMKREGDSFNYYGGIHLGGGMLAHIVAQTYLRMEMRFNLHPGTLMLFNFGLEFRF